MGWLIALAVLAGIAIVPVGLRGIYRESEAVVWLLMGPLKFRLYPSKPKEKKVTDKSQRSAKPRDKKGGNLRDFYPIARTVLEFLEQLRKRITVKNIELKIILAGEDPCDLAVSYGRAWAALGSLMPQLERFLTIRKRNIEVECDYLAETTRVYARLDANLTVARALWLGCRYGVQLIKDILDLKKLRKGGADL